LACSMSVPIWRRKLALLEGLVICMRPRPGPRPRFSLAWVWLRLSRMRAAAQPVARFQSRRQRAGSRPATGLPAEHSRRSGRRSSGPPVEGPATPDGAPGAGSGSARRPTGPDRGEVRSPRRSGRREPRPGPGPARRGCRGVGPRLIDRRRRPGYADRARCRSRGRPAGASPGGTGSAVGRPG
jgi:hypothetical protein